MCPSFCLETYSILESQKSAIWDSFLRANTIGNLWQSVDYGKFASLSPYARTARIIAVRDGAVEGIAQGTFARYLGYGKVMNAREGPVLGMESRDRFGVLKSIMTALEKFGVENHVIGIKIQRLCQWVHRFVHAYWL